MINGAPPDFRNNNPSAYSQEDLALADNPAVLRTDVETQIIRVWEKALIARNFLSFRGETRPVTLLRREKAPTGAVSWINEKGGWRKMDFKHSLEEAAINPYGFYFDVTRDEVDFSDLPTIARNVERATYEMAYFADSLIYQSILDQCPKITGTHWNVYSGDTKGDPITDLGNGKITISTATKGSMKPDAMIMSEQQSLRLQGFDYIRNSLYNTQEVQNGGFVATGRVARLLGMDSYEDLAADPTDAGQVIELLSKRIGTWVQVRPFEVISVEGKYLGDPNVAWRFWLQEQGLPNIESPSLGVVIQGLKA
ncbi:MAG: hypothetical protein LUQ71_10320 [Methanoregula sp.]|nr:hypothetical protein [Methanoregula sp.]